MQTLRSFAIIDYVRSRKYCSMQELTAQFGVSPATIHRDVARLRHKGLIQKVHGGVALIPKPSTQVDAGGDSPFSTRIERETDKKSTIAARAATLVSDGDIVFLDSSTTVLHLARELRSRPLANLTLLTNSVHIIRDFSLFPSHFVLIGLGGTFHPQLNAFLGQQTLANIDRLQIGKAFVSAVGASAEGVTTYHEDHAGFLSHVMARSTRRYLLLDSTKFNRAGLFQFAGIHEFDSLISDAPLPPTLRDNPQPSLRRSPSRGTQRSRPANQRSPSEHNACTPKQNKRPPV